MKEPKSRSAPKSVNASQKKVAFVCFSSSLGGLELSTLRLARAMGRKGVSVFVVVPHSSALEERALKNGLRILPLSLRLKYGDLAASVRLGRFFNQQNIDVAVLMQSKDIHIASFASFIHPQTKLVFYQQMDSGYNKRDLVHSMVFSRLSLWISLTQGMMNKVLKFTRMPVEKVRVVPLGTDLDEFNPKHFGKSAARKSFALPQNRRIVGVLGRLDAQKGQETLLRSIPEVIKNHPNVLFVIAGDETAGETGYKAHLEDLCCTLKIERHVRFLPFTDDVPRFMATLDVFVLPSFAETFGLVVLEAMAMKLPIIATNAGGLPEIITNNKTGLLIEPKDSTALAGAVHRILGNKSLSIALAQSARKEALKRYDFEICVDNLIGLLAAL